MPNESPGDGARLLPEDELLLAELGRDGRMSHVALAALPGVSSVETAPIIRTLKRTGSVH